MEMRGNEQDGSEWKCGELHQPITIGWMEFISNCIELHITEEQGTELQGNELHQPI